MAGTVVVVLIYVLVNVVYLRALGLDGLAATTTPASRAAAMMFGGLGDRFVTAAIAISTFGFLDLAILAPTRVYYAMAADGVFLPALARLHPRYRSPWVAIVLQSAWSCVLALTGRYEQLLNYVVFADWIFFGLTVGTVIVFRRLLPLEQRRPAAFRCPGYPIVPMAFCLVAAAVVVSVVRADPVSAVRGAALLARGCRCSSGSGAERETERWTHSPARSRRMMPCRHSREQPLGPPARRLPQVDDSIVQAGRSSVPELDAVGNDAEPSPERRPWHRLSVEFCFDASHALFEDAAVG